MFYFEQGDPSGQGVQQDQGGYNAGYDLVGRLMSAEYQLGVQERGRAGQQMAARSMADLIGLFLNRLFGR
jgi:hypothetical protein